MTERDVFLDVLREAMSGPDFEPRMPYVPLPAGELPRPIFVGAPGGVAHFVEAWQELGGHVHRASSQDGIVGAVAEAVAGRGPVAVADQADLSDIPRQLEWPLCGLEALADAAVGVVTAVAAVAATGSVVVDAASASGRSISLLPDVAIFVVDVRTIVDTPSDFLRDHPARWPQGPPSQVVLVSGPSRSADIEMTLTVGVHGPGEVHVVLVDSLAGPPVQPRDQHETSG
ncbi:MAG: L-lactate dehydrogenase complex protein LldG [Glaciecola sp.]|jgi:L-lactate dehydrogenase complex protein LldG